jgi:hypothetical protein
MYFSVCGAKKREEEKERVVSKALYKARFSNKLRATLVFVFRLGV